MKQLTAIDRVYTEPDLLGGAFRDRSTWVAWFAFLRAMFGLPLSADELAIYQECTGRSEAPDGPAKEGWLVCGRRAGKSRCLAFLAVYLTCFCAWDDCLALGERGTLLIVATDRRQARVIFRYALALLNAVPSLAAMITRETGEIIELSNGIAIEVATASFRSIRGFTLIAALFDEAAFWRSDDSANPDTEILTAVRPALSTTGGLLLVASSPYAKRGILWNAFRRYFGKPGSILVWRAETLRMNPTVPREIIDEAFEADPAAAAAEYGAQFRDDLELYISREAVDAVTDFGVIERPYQRGMIYSAFMDPSGGAHDSMTLAIAHNENGIGVLDFVAEVKPPFSPDEISKDFAEICRAFCVSSATSDRFGGAWVSERCLEHGLTLEAAEQPKSQYYVQLLPLISSRKVRLLDSKRLSDQLVSLERRTGRGTGRDVVDHAPGGHDDVSNAVAGVLVKVAGEVDAVGVWVRIVEQDRQFDAAQAAAAAKAAAERQRIERTRYWDVRRQAYHFEATVPDGCIRVHCRGEWGLRLDSFSEPIKFMGPGFCDVPRELTGHPYFKNHVKAGGVRFVDNEGETENAS